MTETFDKPPKPDIINPVLALSQCLALYRDGCRMELLLEKMIEMGKATEVDLAKGRVGVKQSAQAIIALFEGLKAAAVAAAKREGPQKPPRRTIPRAPNGLVPWPDDFAQNDRHYNANTEPCDMIVGPCTCGAWHSEEEPWVQAMLEKHNAEISDD
ncbi:MAG: hypothetical protein ABFC88_12460 [Thermoguttaceae bacterium]